jgi:hypothetical protein
VPTDHAGYSETQQGATATPVANGATYITYHYTGNGYDSNQKPVSAGVYQVTVYVAQDGNYLPASATDSFTIAAAPVTPPADTSGGDSGGYGGGGGWFVSDVDTGMDDDAGDEAEDDSANSTDRGSSSNMDRSGSGLGGLGSGSDSSNSSQASHWSPINLLVMLATVFMAVMSITILTRRKDEQDVPAKAQSDGAQDKSAVLPLQWLDDGVQLFEQHGFIARYNTALIVANAVVAIAAVALFSITQDTMAGMVIVDIWTLMFVVLALAALLLRILPSKIGNRQGTAPHTNV